jgi:hypothetical protein
MLSASPLPWARMILRISSCSAAARLLGGGLRVVVGGSEPMVPYLIWSIGLPPDNVNSGTLFELLAELTANLRQK